MDGEHMRSRQDDARDLGWRLLAAIGAGSILGALIGGVGGRLAMFVLRLGSSEALQGATTDDGFEIGRFTTSTVFLISVTAGLGGVLGAAYFVFRGALPRRLRAGTWGLFCGRTR
jgi:Mg/Co/Ni transporter MgtE